MSLNRILNVFKTRDVKATHVKISDLKKITNSCIQNFMVVRILHSYKIEPDIYKFVIVDKSKQVTDLISYEEEGEFLFQNFKVYDCLKIMAPARNNQDPEYFSKRKGRDNFYIIGSKEYIEKLEDNFEEIPHYLNYFLISFLDLNFFHVKLGQDKFAFIDMIALVDEIWDPEKLEEMDVISQKIRLRNELGKKIFIFLLTDQLIGKIQAVNDIIAFKDIKVISGYVAKTNGLPKYFAHYQYTVITKIVEERQMPPEYVEDYLILFRKINKTLKIEGEDEKNNN